MNSKARGGSNTLNLSKSSGNGRDYSVGIPPIRPLGNFGGRIYEGRSYRSRLNG